MSSTILYKFRSGTTFEALPLPGSSARLLDVKKAIVTAKKLDQGSMDFDLSVQDASSGTEYVDDAAFLPRGTRIVVQRLPASRGNGILAKIARARYEGVAPQQQQQQHLNHPASGPPSDFYTIDSTRRDDEDEFVSSSSAANEEKELAALRAATETAGTTTTVGLSRGGGGGPRGGGGGFRPTNQPAGSGPPPQHRSHFQPQHQVRSRANADPEIREQEQQPKKRATGIPRTFLNLSAPPKTDGSDGTGSNVPVLQPNAIGFEELINRGGGQSENTAGTKRDLDYAMKLTAMTIPDYLQCAICHGVVRDAMMLLWDPEGRTTCEQCIRNALTESGFRCPLTHQEGVSPDELVPNKGLRKAAEQFVKEVMARVEEIDKQAKIEEQIMGENDGDGKAQVLEGDGADRGVVLTRRASAAEKRKKEEEDPFGGGDDDFGGDVFAVAEARPEEEEEEETKETTEEPVKEEAPPETSDKVKTEEPTAPTSADLDEPKEAKIKVETTAEATEESKLSSASPAAPTEVKKEQSPETATSSEKVPEKQTSGRRDAGRRRGPPVGYTMGPAGGAVGGPNLDQPTAPSPRDSNPDSRSLRGRGGPAGGRGHSGRFDSNTPRGGRGNAFPAEANGRDESHPPDSANHRGGHKRSRSPGPNGDEARYGHEAGAYGRGRGGAEYGGNRGGRWDRGGRGGRFPPRGGGGRGGRGSWDDRRGGYRGGRGGYRGRGRY